MPTPETIRAYAMSIVADLHECSESELAADESKDTAATIARVETMLGQFAGERPDPAPGDIVIWWRTRTDCLVVLGPGRPACGVVTRASDGLLSINENDGSTSLLPAGNDTGTGPIVVGRVDSKGRPAWR